TGQHVQQRSLAGTRTANNGYPFTHFQLQINIFQHFDLARAFLVSLAQLATLKHNCIIHSAVPPQAVYVKPARPDIVSPESSCPVPHRKSARHPASAARTASN